MPNPPPPAEAPRETARPGRRGTTKAGGQKHVLDKFYTKPEAARACLAKLDLCRYARLIEPSAGDGAFSSLLLADPTLNVVALDLDPDHPSIKQQDWFDFRKTGPEPTLVVGNPPFGQQCSLAIRFINHAFEVVGAQTVAFVLPRSFRKASIQNRVFPYARLVEDVLLDSHSFVLEGSEYDLPAVFQVWERTTTARPLELPPTTSRFFTFTKNTDPHDFAVRRVGGKAGRAFADSADASPQSNYFIRLTDRTVPVAAAIDMVNGLDMSVANNGTGPRTLSKRELVALFDTAYQRLFPDLAA